MPSKRLFMNKLNFDEIKTPFSFIIPKIRNYHPIHD